MKLDDGGILEGNANETGLMKNQSMNMSNMSEYSDRTASNENQLTHHIQ